MLCAAWSPPNTQVHTYVHGPRSRLAGGAWRAGRGASSFLCPGFSALVSSTGLSTAQRDVGSLPWRSHCHLLGSQPSGGTSAEGPAAPSFLGCQALGRAGRLDHDLGASVRKAALPSALPCPDAHRGWVHGPDGRAGTPLHSELAKAASLTRSDGRRVAQGQGRPSTGSRRPWCQKEVLAASTFLGFSRAQMRVGEGNPGQCPEPGVSLAGPAMKAAGCAGSWPCLGSPGMTGGGGWCALGNGMLGRCTLAPGRCWAPSLCRSAWPCMPAAPLACRPQPGTPCRLVCPTPRMRPDRSVASRVLEWGP